MKKVLSIVRRLLMFMFAVFMLLVVMSADSSIKLMIMFFAVASICFGISYVIDSYLYIKYDVDSYFTR